MNNNEAVQRISEILRQPEDLDKISALQSRFSREKSAIDSQLKIGVKNQMDLTLQGIKALQDSQMGLDEIKKEMERIDRLSSESKRMIKDFPLIGRISKIHQNFTTTMKMIESLAGMHSTLDLLEDMLKEDGDDTLGPMHNILAIHFHLSSLMDFRDEAMYQAKSANEDVRHTLSRYFEPLEHITAIFRERLLEVGNSVLEIIRAGNRSLIVRVAKILNIEEKRDAGIQNIDRARENHADLVDKFKSIQFDWKRPRYYKQEFLDSIHTSINQTFKNCEDSFPDDPSSLLENLDWIFSDLGLAKEELTQLVPRQWNIFQIFVGYYNEQACLLIKKLVESEPEAAVILKIVDWIKLYYSNLTELGVTKASLNPKILDGKGGQLIEDYLQLIISKIREWMANMSTSEKTDFLKRVEAPETDADDLYGMHGTVIMFQMVSQQIDVAADSGQGRVLASVIQACVEAMKQRQEEWTKLLEAEVRKQSDTPEEVPGGLLEYTVALANDQIKSADYTESISSRVAPLASAKYAGQITTTLNEAVEGFVDVAQKCISSMTRIVFSDLKSALEQIFTNAWYSGNVMQRVVDTLHEYLSDCKEHMNTSLLECLIEDVMETILVSYLSSIRNKGAKVTVHACMDIIQNDVRLLYSLFATYMPADEVEKAFDPIQQLLNLLSSTPETIQEDYSSLRAAYADVPLWWVESLLKGRDDLESSARKSMLDLVRGIDKATVRAEVTTLMSKLRKN